MTNNIQNWRQELNELVETRTRQLKESNDNLKIEVLQRRDIEKERKHLTEDLKISNTELEQFAYTVSHDLKSPLITVKGFLWMMKKDILNGDSSKINKDMERISKAVDKMQTLLTDVLEMSRVGRKQEEYENVKVVDLAYDVIELLSGPIAEKCVNVKVLRSDSGVAYVDRGRMRTVLQNLIENAIKFMGDQTESYVEIGSREDKGEIVYYVRDNGIGIDQRYQDRVFGLFDKLDTEAEGTGFGLALVKKIIETHGGRIWVESEGKGKGSTFCFVIAPKKGG